MHWLTPQEHLRGPRVTLRPPRWDEMSFIRRLWSDPDTMAAVGGPCDLSDERARDWYGRMVDPGSREHCYCVIFNESEGPVGEISFHRLDANMRATLNIKVFATERGRGHGREALLLFLDFFFHRVGGQCMEDDVAPANTGGQQLLLQAGFEQDRARRDACLLRMTRQRFLARYGGGDVERSHRPT